MRRSDIRYSSSVVFFFFQAEDGIRDVAVTGVQTCALPISRDLASADPAVLEQEIHSTGFFRNKTKSIIGMAQALLERHGGEVPDTMEALVQLPGVGRKTANVVLGTWFRKNEGIVVDTHAQRLSTLLGLTRGKDPVKI